MEIFMLQYGRGARAEIDVTPWAAWKRMARRAAAMAASVAILPLAMLAAATAIALALSVAIAIAAAGVLCSARE